MVNEVIAGRYEVKGLVGTGGMSSVFLAYDRLLERRVALKMLHAELGADEEYVERFRREARAVARLSHPNIVTVIDRGEQDGRQFIVFEYVDGENLKELVEREGPLPVREALGIALQVGRALAFAHDQGLIHRDVKPHNVLLDDGGRARVTDFGIARSMDVDEASTASGAVVGTSHYIAPEQAEGQTVDEQTDVYSLGAVLYELLTGEVPFPGENFVVVAMRHVNDPVPSVRKRRPDVSPRLDAAIARAMAKDPDDRFASMEEFLAELEACGKDLAAEGGETMIIERGRPPEAVPVAARRRRWPWLVVPLVLLLAVAAGAAAYFLIDRNSTKSSTPPPPPPSRAVRAKPVGTYDPLPGDGEEHDSDVPKAADRDTATYWSTEHYNSGLDGANKKGVGLVLDAGRKARLRDLTLTTDTPGFSFELRGGTSAGGPFPTRIVGTRLAAATTRIGVPDDASSFRYYVIWITDLGTYDSVHVNEVHTS